jgi:hypothetical protein
MVGLRLFLPETWTGDEARLERAGVPAEYRSARAVNGAAIFLKSGAAKFPSLAGLGCQPCG